MGKKLSCIVIRGKMLKSIHGTYERMKSCERSKNVLSDIFKFDVKQVFYRGRAISRIFFYLSE